MGSPATGPEIVACAVSTEPIDVAGLSAAVARRSAGAVVSFVGAVRDHDHGRPVLRLEYEAHPSALDVLARVVAETVAPTGVEAVAVVHRVGALSLGDAALVVCVSAAHREPAFAAAALLVDQVKEHLPVWKHQFFADGSDEWVACP